jgi:hypothetical protein
MTKRALRPKATSSLSITPATVSDLTAPAVIGLEAWQFRELLRDAQIPHARIGRRVVARVDLVVAAIDNLARQGDAVAGAPTSDDDGPSVDEILASIGRVRTGAGRR